MKQITVSANKKKVDSYIELEKDQDINITVTGTVSHGDSAAYGPEGTGSTDGKCVFKDLPVSALVGWVESTNNSFHVNTRGFSGKAPAKGRLYFSVNDWSDHYGNNTGKFTLEITVPGQMGSLRVVSSAPETGTGGGAGAEPVEEVHDQESLAILLDASSSMEDNTVADGRTRMKAAKDVLKSVINDDLTAGMPVTLRVFGPNSLNKSGPSGTHNGNGYYTQRIQDLEPLDKAAMCEVIDGIEAHGWTPIAASIAQVKDDLKDAPQQNAQNVVLVTDGDENCGGDVLEEIKKLRDAGLDVVVNVVGYAIRQESHRKKFKDWAEAGGGSYYDATDVEDFTEAMKKAVGLPYWILATNYPKTEGYVDDPAIELLAGQYFITLNPLHTSASKFIGPYTVTAGNETTVHVERFQRSGDT